MASTVDEVAVVGLGAMGLGMASNLVRQGKYHVKGFDIRPDAVEQFKAAGGQTGLSAREVAYESHAIICMAATTQQVDDILFNTDGGALQDLANSAVIFVCSTVPHNYTEALPQRIAAVGRPDLHVIDCPVSGGTVKAEDGSLTIFASAGNEAMAKALPILKAMSSKLYPIPGGVGAASKIKMINQLLVGTHIAAAAEAVGLATRAGLEVKEVFDIVSRAAGNSWAFENRVPHMVSKDWAPRSALNIFVKDMGIVMGSARSSQFPLPMAAVAEQLFIAGAARGYGHEDDSGLVRLFLDGTPVPDGACTSSATRSSADGEPTPASSPHTMGKIAVVGLGAMGSGMARSIVRGGYTVHGFDIFESSVRKFASTSERALASSTAEEAIKDADVLLLVVQNAAQARDVLFGSGRAATTLRYSAVVLLCSTVPPSFACQLEQELHELGRDVSLLDCPISGGAARAAKGDLMVLCSGRQSSISKAHGVLLAMTGSHDNLCRVRGGVGAASAIKMINQLLAGVHIATAAEAMAFSAHLGLDTRMVFELLKNAAGWSWMMENRVPQMLDTDWTPFSSLAIFVKDLGIVLQEAKRLTCFAPMSSAAHTLYIAGANKGWSGEADAGVIRLWQNNKVSSTQAIPMTIPETAAPEQCSSLFETLPLDAERTFAALPPAYPHDVLGAIRQNVANGSCPTLVILDDDPTGTQTCHDVDVLTVWDMATLESQFARDPSGFFILTNSRALPPVDAKELILEICDNVKGAAGAAGKEFEIVLRGDSTLRGHLPEEPVAVEEALGPFDAWVIAPFFQQGGRLTVDDVHFVREGDSLIPASQTPFAQDATFGYKHANLRKFIREKCGTRFGASSFVSITLEDIRAGGPKAVTSKALSLPRGLDTSVIIVNAVLESDMHVVVAGLLEAARAGRRYLYRTAAAFVSSRLGISQIEPIEPAMLELQDAAARGKGPGGLIVAGSYVPKTTAQLELLRKRRGGCLETIELDVSELIKSDSSRCEMVTNATAKADACLRAGRDVLVMTSRVLKRADDGLASLQIGSRIAVSLVELVRAIESRPRYVIAKGGITSSDMAAKALGMKRARILGQAAPGVPLWRCDELSSRHPGVPFIVFPGNVGDAETLADIVERWAMPSVG